MFIKVDEMTEINLDLVIIFVCDNEITHRKYDTLGPFGVGLKVETH